MRTRSTRALLFLCAVLTVGALGVWGATGWHAYTKYQVTEMVPVEVSAEDPFAGTDLYEGSEALEARSRNEFHLGVFPTPRSLLDKHAVSVLTVAVPPWVALGLVAWRGRRSRRH